ncbi:MAG: hypothetical protein ACREQ5_09290 [Candidatus Dormibacteria bacterium]
MSARDVKRKAADAARALLTDRITAVEKLGLALHDYHTAQDAVTKAQTHAEQLAQKARAAFQSARTAGWTATELHRAGLTVPAPPRAKNATRESPPTPKEAATAVTPPLAPNHQDARTPDAASVTA